jgi:hypothetical protein
MLAAVSEANMSSGTPVKGPEAVEGPQSSARQRSSFQGSDGLIPVNSVDTEEVYYIVDCPALHMIEATILFTDGYYRGSNVSYRSSVVMNPKVTPLFVSV